MSYEETMQADLKRVKQILEKGKLTIGELGSLNDLSREARDHIIANSGHICAGDSYAAYKLLESVSQELEKFYGLFSDYEDPCESFEHAQAIWNMLKEREYRLKRPLREGSQDEQA